MNKITEPELIQTQTRTQAKVDWNWSLIRRLKTSYFHWRFICVKAETHLDAVSPLTFSHHLQLPLGLTPVLPQSLLQEATLTAGQEEGTGQTEEVVRRRRRDTEDLLLLWRTGPVPQQTEELLDLRGGQNRFDVVGEEPRVRLQTEDEENKEETDGFSPSADQI